MAASSAIQREALPYLSQRLARSTRRAAFIPKRAASSPRRLFLCCVSSSDEATHQIPLSGRRPESRGSETSSERQPRRERSAAPAASRLYGPAIGHRLDRGRARAEDLPSTASAETALQRIAKVQGHSWDLAHKAPPT